MSHTFPLVGSMLKVAFETISLRMKDPNDNRYIGTKVADDIVGKDVSVTALYFAESDCTLHISDPKIVQDLYTVNNKYFDKHPIVREATIHLLGNSILFSDTDAEWRKRRTAFSPAFYKGKLVQMVEIAKQSMAKTVSRWKAIGGGRPRIRFDFMEEMSIMSSRILLSCALGEDISETLIPYRANGRTEMRPLNFVLLQTFFDCLNRMASPHTCWLPFLRTKLILPYERAILANCRAIRRQIAQVI